MDDIETFLSPADETDIIAAIQRAELLTSGEIRVHIENTVSKEPIKQAAKIFRRLEMHKTKARNGVLIYIAVKSKKFVIYGDKGINSAVPDDFWHVTKDVMEAHFKTGDFKQGIIEGIEKAGEQLQKYFPHEEDDQNELSDEISRS